MMKNKIKFFLQEDPTNHGGFVIPSHVGFIIIMIVGLGVSWITVHIGEQIINSMPNSQITQHNKQIQQAIDNAK